MQKFYFDGATFSYTAFGDHDNTELPVIVWAHGWGQSHQSFQYFFAPFEHSARHIALDFPGFGHSQEPPEHWGTAQYADAVAAWLKKENFPAVVWIGHSFGCRVGTQLAARHPEYLRAMVYIAGAGLKRPRPLYKSLYLFLRIRLFKALRRLVPKGALKKAIMSYFGSADYNHTSGVMRQIFVRVVNENLAEEAQKIACPVALIYGSEDTETPPELGKTYARLIKKSELHILEGQDHYSVLSTGRHRVIKIINDVLKHL
ncbi:MAG: alpha/beta fold hydrolase [Alphaproteobacteria bacterium]